MKKPVAKTPLTKDELTYILKDYPTKDDLTQRLTAFQNAFRIEIRHEFSIMREEMSAYMSKFTDLIYTAIDPLLKELESRREDHEIGIAQLQVLLPGGRLQRSGSHDSWKVDGENKRITKLEHS